MNDEMKVYMLLIKQRVKNEFELIKNGYNTQNFMLKWKDPRVQDTLQVVEIRVVLL